MVESEFRSRRVGGSGSGRLPDTTTDSRQSCTENTLVINTCVICYKITSLV